MNNKKNKKQRGGFVDMTNPMVIGVIVISCLACIYFGLVFIGGFVANPLEWFNSGKIQLSLFPPEHVLDSTGSLSLEELDVPLTQRNPDPNLFKEGGKLLKKFRRK